MNNHNVAHHKKINTVCHAKIPHSIFVLSRPGFSVALEPVLQGALVDQAGPELTEILLPLPPECCGKGVHHHCMGTIQHSDCHCCPGTI